MCTRVYVRVCTYIYVCGRMCLCAHVCLCVCTVFRVSVWVDGHVPLQSRVTVSLEQDRREGRGEVTGPDRGGTVKE